HHPTLSLHDALPISSGGAVDNPENIRTRPMENGRTFKSWGCDAVGDDVFVFTLDQHGQLTKHSSCFDFRTVGEQLTHAGVDWALDRKSTRLNSSHVA